MKAANKGSGTVVMDPEWYINECIRQLNNSKFYRRLDIDITSNIQKRVQIFIKRLNQDGFIDYKTKQFLIQTDPKPGRFYILPKIHKHGNPRRPIVSSNGQPHRDTSLSSLTTISNTVFVSSLISSLLELEYQAL